mmetsp:Transcript_116110/g.335344  ORF Transcript_116110/g.335344 Transcript_116110/m.335344 type:complete len:204 (+) Transcript_116110:684-1295(+)
MPDDALAPERREATDLALLERQVIWQGVLAGDGVFRAGARVAIDARVRAPHVRGDDRQVRLHPQGAVLRDHRAPLALVGLEVLPKEAVVIVAVRVDHDDALAFRPRDALMDALRQQLVPGHRVRARLAQGRAAPARMAVRRGLRRPRFGRGILGGARRQVMAGRGRGRSDRHRGGGRRRRRGSSCADGARRQSVGVEEPRVDP